MGRTARNLSVGQSLLMLLPSELDGMFRQFKIHRIPMDQNESKIEVNPKKIVDMQRKIQAHLASDPELKASAQRAFQGIYWLHVIKKMFWIFSSKFNQNFWI